MSTAPPVQIPSTSVDIYGISAATTTRSVSDARLGTIYDPTNIAAATPIYFHPTGILNQFVAVFSSRYTNGTTSTTDPGSYTSWTPVTSPSWAMIDSVTGQASPIHGSYTIPMTTTNTSAVVTGACSVAPNYLYILNTVTSGGTTSAVIQHFYWSNTGVMYTLAEETIPSITVDGQTVLFDRGIYFDNRYVVAIGYGLTDNRIYLARKQFGGIGSNPNYQWLYTTDKGLSQTSTEAAAQELKGGESYLHTYGPCSAVVYKGRLFLSTVQIGLPQTSFPVSASLTGRGSGRGSTNRAVRPAISGSGALAAKTRPGAGFPSPLGHGTLKASTQQVYTGIVYTPTTTGQWQTQGIPVPLGIKSSTYLGGLYLQQQLGASPTHPVLVDQTNVAGYPYVTSTLPSSGKVSTSWYVFGIPRLT